LELDGVDKVLGLFLFSGPSLLVILVRLDVELHHLEDLVALESLLLLLDLHIFLVLLHFFFDDLFVLEHFDLPLKLLLLRFLHLGADALEVLAALVSNFIFMVLLLLLFLQRLELVEEAPQLLVLLAIHGVAVLELVLLYL